MATILDNAILQIRALKNAPVLPVVNVIDPALVAAALNTLVDAIESGAVPSIYDPTNPQKVT